MQNLRKKLHIFCWKSHSGGQEDQILRESLFTGLREGRKGGKEGEEVTIILLCKVASYSIILTLTNCDGCPIIFSSANKSVQNTQVKLYYLKKWYLQKQIYKQLICNSIYNSRGKFQSRKAIYNVLIFLPSGHFIWSTSILLGNLLRIQSWIRHTSCSS